MEKKLIVLAICAHLVGGVDAKVDKANIIGPSILGAAGVGMTAAAKSTSNTKPIPKHEYTKDVLARDKVDGVEDADINTDRYKPKNNLNEVSAETNKTTTFTKPTDLPEAFQKTLNEFNAENEGEVINYRDHLGQVEKANNKVARDTSGSDVGGSAEVASEADILEDGAVDAAEDEI